MKNRITEILGWYGVVVIVLAYVLLSFDVFTSKSLVYQILNFTGAIGIMVDALDDKDYQPVVLNLIWAVVALITVFRIFF